MGVWKEGTTRGWRVGNKQDYLGIVDDGGREKWGKHMKLPFLGRSKNLG